MINNNIHGIIEHLSFLIEIKAHSNVNYRKINNFSLICNICILSHIRLLVLVIRLILSIVFYNLYVII